MGLYGFQEQFVPYVLDGSKTHTIRAKRKHQDKPGDTMHLYTGLRHKGAKLLMRVPCVAVQEVSISLEPDGTSNAWMLWIKIDGELLYHDEIESFLWRDGFRPEEGATTSRRMAAGFWRKTLPFEGHIYHWDFEKRVME
jgi:hypothetical protein